MDDRRQLPCGTGMGTQLCTRGRQHYQAFGVGEDPETKCEYFNMNFLLHKIGSKIARVLRVDSTTANMEWGQYPRLCIEVDLTKPLLSKFRLNRQIWDIQYEGLKMICFKCGKQGHKEAACANDKQQESEGNVTTIQPTSQPNQNKTTQEEATYGSWMLVKKPGRRSNRQQNQIVSRGGERMGTNRSRQDSESNPGQAFLERERKQVLTR